MSWAKLSDDYTDDCWTLSDEAFRLHTEALVWNGRKLLDCRIPKDDLRRFAKSPHAVDELLACGWWSEQADCYVIRHHAQYQRTREAVVNQQAANATNGAKGGRPRKPREQVSSIKAATETQSVNESLEESGTERDRTGQDRQLGGSSTDDSRFFKPADEMPTRPTPHHCSVCSGPLTSPLDKQDGICASCDNRAHREFA